MVVPHTQVALPRPLVDVPGLQPIHEADHAPEVVLPRRRLPGVLGPLGRPARKVLRDGVPRRPRSLREVHVLPLVLQGSLGRVCGTDPVGRRRGVQRDRCECEGLLT